MTIRRLSLVTVALATTLALAGCQGVGSSASPSRSASATPAASASVPAAYPRTVTLDGASVEIPASVRRVVALSPDVADVAMALVGPERIAAVPELTRRAVHSTQSGAAAAVEHTLDANAGKDPEKLLALQPDLILLTTRHAAEVDALAQLRNAGVPVLAVQNDWDTPETYERNVTAIAAALGAEDRGRDLVAQHHTRWDKVKSAVATTTDRPTVAMIRILGPNTWLNGPGTIGHTILREAGAVSAADSLGLKAGAKLDVEQLVKVNPAHIVVVDSSGKGREQYDAILSDPALASVDAITNRRITVVTSAELSSGTGGIAAYERIAAALHPDAVK